MAFAFRKIMSNIGYFKKPEDDGNSPPDPPRDLDTIQQLKLDAGGDAEFINLECTEPDSTSIHNSMEFSTSLKFPENINFSTKKGSLSDTDLLTINLEKTKKIKRSKKLKLDIKKANQSCEDSLNRDNIENTPKHILLECKSSEVFSERMKKFNLNKTLEVDSESDHSSYEEEHFDIESLSDEDEISLESDDKGSIKMCRKVGSESEASNKDTRLVPSTSLESFADVEVDKNEEERIIILQNYQLKIGQIESLLKKLLTEFQFHIEVAKVFNCKSFVTALNRTNISNIPKIIAKVNKVNRGISPTWDIIMENEDNQTKNHFKNQLQSIQKILNTFINTHLESQQYIALRKPPALRKLNRSNTYDVFKVCDGKVGIKSSWKMRSNNKKKNKLFDYPDIRDAMLQLFSMDAEIDTNMSLDDTEKCVCRCHRCLESSPSETDSGLKMNAEHSMSITSSIGNFTLDTSTLTAYSESLDQIISYNSFQDTSLYSALLQKAAIERITFYVQAHSIQMNCETLDEDFDSKNVIAFYCPSCNITEFDENCLLKHILSQTHCEKIHFLYKKSYIKKCVAAGKEIQPSTVLNPMKMYRDDNKIVCFGDAIYACSLCFENVIVGESVLMAHCSETDHIERREKLAEILD